MEQAQAQRGRPERPHTSSRPGALEATLRKVGYTTKMI